MREIASSAWNTCSRRKASTWSLPRPPYNIGIRYSAYNDRVPQDEYLEWMERWGRLIRRVLTPGGSLFLN